MARFLRLPGRTPYRVAHELQQRLVADRIADAIDDTVLLLEHDPVITVGRKREALANVLRPDGVDVVTVERGGDVTWHGPGQLVAYPIVKRDGPRRDVHKHLRALEDAVMGLLVDLGLDPTRDERNSGVWLPGEHGNHKVCSVGVALRDWVTWHGLALNVTADLDGFARINPCGFDAGVMTRLADHLRPCPPLDALVAPLAAHLARALAIGAAPVEVLDFLAAPPPPV